MVRANGELIWESEALRVTGEVKRAAGIADATEVEADLHAAVEVARRQGAKAFELRATTSLARHWAEQGECRKAHDLLAPVHGWFTEGFDMPDLQEATTLLDRLG
jgi:predicted ATPase